ncbi:MAG: CHAT domain-containing protein [Bryobacteraceae bacterium]
MDAAELVKALANEPDANARRALAEAWPELHTPALVDALYEEVVKLTRVDLQQAGHLAQAARWLSGRMRDEYCRAQAQRATGHVLYARGKYARALERYEAALAILERLGRETDVGRTLSGALHTLIYLGRYPQALEWAARAREIFERQGDRLRLARLDSNAGNILYRQDRFEEAQALYQRAYLQFLESGTPSDIAAALSNMAVCAISLNDFERALQHYREAREWCGRHGMPLLVAEADYNIAYLYYLRGEYARSIELYRQAREHCKRLDDHYHQALCDLDQAEMYLELNLSEDGEELAARALERFSQLGLGYEAAKATAFLAIAASHQGRTDRAVELFADARGQFVKEGNRVWPALMDLYKALVLYQACRFQAARRLCRAAFQFFSASSLGGKAAVCELLLARLDIEAGRLDRAAGRARSALQRAESAAAPALEYQGWFVLGCVEEARGNREQALDAFRKAHVRLESLRSNLRGEELKIAFLKDKLAVYESLVEMSLEEPRAAFGYIEQAKSRSLADLIAFRAHALPATVSSPVAGRIGQLRQELNWSYRQIELRETRGGGPGQVETLRRRARHYEDELAHAFGEMQSADHEFMALQNAQTVDLEVIQASLPPGTLLLEYYLAREAMYACLVGRGRLRIVPLGPAAPVRDAFRLLRFQLSKFRLGGRYIRTFGPALESATREHLSELYRRLVAPVRREMDGGSLVVAPHGFLHYLPFHALWDGQRYLADEFAVSYAPSASVYALCARKPPRAGGGSLVLAVPDALAPFIREEGEAVARALPGARLYLGPQASEARLREHGAESRFIHIATHGLFRQDNPMFSSIRLGDSQLTLFDLYQLRLGAELVSLSGCGTGLNVVVGGDELLGLVRGLLYAGARSVLVTLWDVNDRSTAEFMELFYARLGSAAGSADALRQAMAELRERYPHPYYWAPFVLVGCPAHV